VVYCSSAHIGGRKTQYDMWNETDLGNPETVAPLLGRPALLLGGPPNHWASSFETLTDIGQLENEPRAQGTTYTGLNFMGFKSSR
ncbi:unnamed protein product, partial [Laminaria digitata]